MKTLAEPQIKSKKSNPNGLHQKYVVKKADGSPVDPNAMYFVLRLDNGSSDPDHVDACQQAASAYARAIQRNSSAKHLHQTAAEILDLIRDLRKGT